MHFMQEFCNYRELLTPAEMAIIDRLAAETGPYDGYGLMRNAGAAIFKLLLSHYPDSAGFDILCGPGNNGGDGYEVARLLAEAGVQVNVWTDDPPRPRSDAERAARHCPVKPQPLASFQPRSGGVVIDALYGAGLARPLTGPALAAAQACNDAKAIVVAVDLPSGISGESGKPHGIAFRADLTVTFFRLKPGHLLEPGRSLCGQIMLADIGIPEKTLASIPARSFINLPALWRDMLPPSQHDQHKYSRGHLAVFSGGPSSTGAARLAAMAAARAGAGAVTLYSPGNALLINAVQLTSIMLRTVDTPEDFIEIAAERPPDALVLGPGFGLDRPLREMVTTALALERSKTLLLDADGISIFQDQPATLFAAIASSALEVVLTPHAGEFSRLFPDLASNATMSKLECARQAAQRAGAIIVLKGPDTVIAAPDGRAAINVNGTPWLATAGSGDVLAGLIAGLAAQKMPLWQAACAGVWIHSQAAVGFSPGLIAEDLPHLIPDIVRELYASTRDCNAIAPKGARGLPAVMK